MAKERLPMHRVREVLRLKHVCRLSNRKIARACGVDRDTVGMYLKRAEKAGLGWPLPETLVDSELEACLFPKLAQKPPGTQRSLPECFRNWHMHIIQVLSSERRGILDGECSDQKKIPVFTREDTLST